MYSVTFSPVQIITARDEWMAQAGFRTRKHLGAVGSSKAAELAMTMLPAVVE